MLVFVLFKSIESNSYVVSIKVHSWCNLSVKYKWIAMYFKIVLLHVYAIWPYEIILSPSVIHLANALL